MIPRPDFYPAEASEIPGPDLFMTVIKVVEWDRVVDWYVNTFGLLRVLNDEDHRFALLAAGSGRLAIQGDPAPGTADGTRLVFVVPDVEAERTRLVALGVEVGPVRENTREHYREIQLLDPAGTPLTLFSWTGRAPGPRPDHPPE